MTEKHGDGHLASSFTIDDFEEHARKRLSKTAYDYFRSGAGDERTLRRNRKAFREWEIWYRVLIDVSEIDLSASVGGEKIAFPIVVAPTAYHKLAHPEGEVETARGAARAGAIFTLSTLSTTSLEDVAAASDGPKWFQLYVHKDRGLTKSLVERAEAAGFQAIVLTVDAPVLGRRIADERNAFALPAGMSMANLELSVDREMTVEDASDGSALADYVASRHDATLSWTDLDWIQSLSNLPLYLKGIVRPDDAARAVAAGVRGIVVSNHGARQLDGAPATIDALPGIVDVVGGGCSVLLDGGVRWGTDILKALALGANAVMLGRPVLWGLAVNGANGVQKVLELLRDDLANAMALAGCPDLGSIDRDLVKRRTA